MSRLKLLAAAMLLALPIISACGDDVPPPPPTGSIDGLVSIEGQGQDGISVTLSNGATVTTTNGGMFRFDGVEAGAYTVTISNYPDDASFNQTSAAATIATDGENVTVNFPGTWIRTSAIMGTVTVENEGLGGVTVKLSGMSDSETITDGNGQFAFSGLRAGNYTVQISGFDDEDVAFGSTSSAAMVSVGESKVVTFEGTYLRASAITGQVTVEDNPLEGVMVSLQGKGEDRTATTNGAGQFTFSELRRGDYSVGITNPDADEYSFEVTSKTVTIAHGETGTASFDGVLLRTATIIGTVTVENVGGIGGVTVTIQGGEQGQEHIETTNDAGQFSFTQLYAGDYSVGISGFDDDLYGFDVTTATITVERKTTATVEPFEGIELRTAGIEGTITVDGGHPLPGVTVTVTGGPRDEEHTRVTDDVGYYLVEELHAGVYTVAISDFDENEYEFEATTRTIDVGLRTTANVAFQGDLLRTAGISGRVSVEGMGLDGITVTLSGDADDEMMTADGGQYAFAGLAAGDYNVAIEGWDDVAYSFDMTSADLMVMQDSSEIQNFEGMHTRTASVSGMLFLDEVNADGMLGEGEPTLAMTAEMMAALAAAGIPGVPLLLQGPGVNDVQFGAVMPDGSYAFEGLTAGSYRVLINMTDELAAAISLFGFRFSGELTGQVVNVAAGMAASVNFPFRITTQTIVAGAVLGYADSVAHGLPMVGVSLELYPNADDADNGTNPLGMATTDTLGMAVFHFPRAMDTGPGGQGTDHLVFIKYAGAAIPGIVASDNEHIEVSYASTARVSQAPTAVRVLNTIANFQWWVKSDAEAKDGNEFLEDWTATNGVATDEDGLATLTAPVAVDDLPMTFEVAIDDEASQPDSGERWTQSDMLTHTHTGLEHPALNTHMVNDLGALYVTWTTQSLTLGVYREIDDEEGFTDYRGPGGDAPAGDHRPHSEVGADMVVELLTRDERDRLRLYDEWDDDCDDDGEKEMPTDPVDAELNLAGGMVTFGCLPADEEFTVRFKPGDDREQLDYGYDEIETFGDDLDFGMTVGAFGAMSGAGPEVRMCSASAVDTSDDWCATFAYQWNTGMVYGTVGEESGHEVVVEPETGQGAIGDEDETNADGEYSIGGLQDGVYTATATSGDADFQLTTPAEVDGIVLFHNEACWAATNPDPATGDDPPVACAGVREEEMETGTNDDGETTYTYRNAQMVEWETDRLNMAIRGYVANDGQDGEDMDGLLRGDEAKAGVTVTLLNSAGTVSLATTETTADGFYEFDELEAGSYTVSASSGSNYRAIHAINRHPRTRAWRYVTSKTATAEDYTLSPAEADLAKPYWMRAFLSTGRTMGNDEVTYRPPDWEAGDPEDTYYNFALVYTDGELTGSVNNLSGSNGSIDIVLETPSPLDTDRKTDTNTGGNFEFSDLIEAIGYTATIEDVGFAQPCVDEDGDPDDDARQDDPDNPGNEICIPAPDSLTADIEGENDHEGMGTLHVYSTTASANDSLSNGVRVRFRQQGTTTDGTYNDTTSALAFTDDARNAETETTENTSNLGTISWQSESVTFWFGTAAAPLIPTGASVKLMVGTETCSGYTCNLEANETGDAAIGTPMENTITVTVTAENGYDDHAYSLLVTRADPVGNALANTNIQLDSAGTAGRTAENAGTDVFTFTTYDEATSANLIFGLTVLGVVDDNAYCAQRVSVKATGGNAIQPMDDDDDDVCPSTRYNLAASASPGASYDVTVMSEDGEPKVYNLRVIVGPEDTN